MNQQKPGHLQLGRQTAGSGRQMPERPKERYVLSRTSIGGAGRQAGRRLYDTMAWVRRMLATKATIGQIGSYISAEVRWPVLRSNCCANSSQPRTQARYDRRRYPPRNGKTKAALCWRSTSKHTGSKGVCGVYFETYR